MAKAAASEGATEGEEGLGIREGFILTTYEWDLGGSRHFRLSFDDEGATFLTKILAFSMQTRPLQSPTAAPTPLAWPSRPTCSA